EEPGAAWFAELLALDGRADKEDYFDAASGTWDVEGLQDDLRLAKVKSLPAVPQVAKTAAPRGDGAELLSTLQRLDPTSSQEDYFDAATGNWDLEGLQDDLRLAQA
ncbi:unnamed protein product, partial [Effrenium voratum]